MSWRLEAQPTSPRVSCAKRTAFKLCDLAFVEVRRSFLADGLASVPGGTCESGWRTGGLEPAPPEKRRRLATEIICELQGAKVLPDSGNISQGQFGELKRRLFAGE